LLPGLLLTLWFSPLGVEQAALSHGHGSVASQLVGRIGVWGMTKFRLPNDFEDHEARALLDILRENASTFIDWGYDDTNFWVGLDSQARNPWPYLLRELFERLDAPSEQLQMAMFPLVVRMRTIS
jgi:hypothetical protein